MERQRAKSIRRNELLEVELEKELLLKVRRLLLQRGEMAQCERSGEKEFKNKGVAYCPTATDRCLQGRMWP